MLIVKENILTLSSGSCCLGDQVFSGVALKVDAGIVVDKQLYRNGERQDFEFLPPFSKFKSSVEDADFDSLEGIEEPYFLNGSEFCGCAYKFDNGICNSVMQYEFGFAVSDAAYHDGRLTKLEFSEEDSKFSQAFNWENDGTFSRYRITDQGRFNFSIVFLNSQVTTLTIDGQYFDEINNVRDKVSYLDFSESASLKGLAAASCLYVSGSAVDDIMFYGLFENEGLQNTSKLRIARTAITSDTLIKLSDCKRLEYVSVESDVMTSADLREFKRKRPDCSVEFNREEINA